MGDRTAVSLRIHDCPRTQINNVIDVINNYRLCEDEWEGGDGNVTTLKLRFSYRDNETSVGFADEAGSALAALPGVSFTVQEDGYADWLGETWTHVPGVGTLRQECNNEGEAVYNADEILKGLEEFGAANVRQWLGLHVLEAADRLDEQNKDVELAYDLDE